VSLGSLSVDIRCKKAPKRQPKSYIIVGRLKK